ncbi:NAD(P)H-binding protein [Streptomyces litchfieldiae]|uniref:NAD(P)H-binding protein n=1 Tax=Streptomyces litchfieldiae TaxID=3075543 RepID=A0ABU2MSF9_9ACTN|nr:NAD(P)H-binding protein [Streptomyces sp. DSM 44938]MDT0344569.1 NAD(P)H-binding protein [Streptomyces sp. DSM 44938]
MILVTGATGGVGRPLVELLHAGGTGVRAVTRNAAAAGLPAGVEVVEADLNQPTAIADELTGVSSLFLNPEAVGDSARDLLKLAREAGVRRVVLLSGIAVDPPTLAIEEAVAESGLERVILRPGMFATGTLALWAGQIRAGDTVAGPYARSQQAPIDPRDLAAVAAQALLTDELVKREPKLTGPESLTHAEMVGVIGTALERPLRYEEVPPEAAKRGMAGLGIPEPVIDAYLALLRETVDRPALVTDEVERILGRPATPYAAWVRDHLDAFRGTDS